MLTILVATALTIADPPGSIVIRPQGSPPTSMTPAPPGMIVIRPQAPGTATIATPQAPVTPQPTTPQPTPSPGRPVADPKPIDNPQPATPGGSDKNPADPNAFNPESGKVIAEAWDVAFVKGHKVGYFHVVVREYTREGNTYIYATKKQSITIGRFGQQVTTVAEDATLESVQGAVLVTRMSQEVSTGAKLVITGQVDKTMLRTRAEGMLTGQDSVPWPEGVIGISKEMTFFKDRKPKPGEVHEYNVYEGRVNRAVKVTVTVKSLDVVALFEGQQPKAYLKCEARMEPIGKFKMPPATLWVDAETYEPTRMDQDNVGLGGRLTLIRTTKEVALRPIGKVPDLFDVQSIKLEKEVPDIHSKSAVTYRVSVPEDDEPFTCFANSLFDDRQKVSLETDRKTIQLRVLGQGREKPVPVTGSDGKPMQQPPVEIFQGTSFFIDWDNDITKRQAAEIASKLPVNATAFDKARAVERWVNQNMKSVEFSQAMAPTSQVSKNLTGDCTEYAMLCVGLCRALGVSSHTVIGLIYSANNGRPVLAYHMWFEVWHDMHWVPFDATLARGGVGPGHLKITDAHWHKETSFAPLLPVLRVLNGQPKVDVLAVEP